jgi:uncharacterized cupin superfamily protein
MVRGCFALAARRTRSKVVISLRAHREAPETAHQIVNTSERELKVLGISTKLSPEIVDYPESNKIDVMGTFPGPDGKPTVVRFLTRTGESLGYWDEKLVGAV